MDNLLDHEAGPKPASRAFQIIWKSLLVATALLAVASVYSFITAAASSRLSLHRHDSDNADAFKILPVLLRNLVEEGLIKKGQRGFIPGASSGDIESLSDIDLLTGADLKGEGAQEFDFVFSADFMWAHALGSIVKENGLVIAPLSRNPLKELRLSGGYKIVYLRRFQTTVVAMRKSGGSNEALPEEKKAALKGLEDVDLEPPRQTEMEVKSKSNFISRKIKFLPDLLSDTLDEYPRRVFISDDSSAVDWFHGNYPKNDQEFEVYNVGENRNKGVSNWLSEKVRKEDYVVMKAEAQVVEEMLRDKTLSLVDELFLQCKNQWVDGEEKEGSKRAYWQCLTLYGKVRDEGIAVHQWWD